MNTEDPLFRQAVGRYIAYRGQLQLMCRVCGIPVPTWGLQKKWCCCAVHAKQVAGWAKETSIGGHCDGWGHATMGHFVERGIASVKLGFTQEQGRCACCGQDGSIDTEVVLRYGADKSSEKGDGQAMCLY